MLKRTPSPKSLATRFLILDILNDCIFLLTLILGNHKLRSFDSIPVFYATTISNAEKSTQKIFKLLEENISQILTHPSALESVLKSNARTHEVYLEKIAALASNDWQLVWQSLTELKSLLLRNPLTLTAIKITLSDLGLKSSGQMIYETGHQYPITSDILTSIDNKIKISPIIRLLCETQDETALQEFTEKFLSLYFAADALRTALFKHLDASSITTIIRHAIKEIYRDRLSEEAFKFIFPYAVGDSIAMACLLINALKYKYSEGAELVLNEKSFDIHNCYSLAMPKQFDYVDLFNFTPLILAVYHDNLEIIKFLVAKKVNPFVPDRNKDTALNMAKRAAAFFPSSGEIIALLEEHEKVMTEKNNEAKEDLATVKLRWEDEATRERVTMSAP